MNEADVVVTVGTGASSFAAAITSHGYDFERMFYFVELEEPVEEDGTRVIIEGSYQVCLHVVCKDGGSSYMALASPVLVEALESTTNVQHTYVTDNEKKGDLQVIVISKILKVCNYFLIPP